jgi:hypothetical protein
MSAFGPKRTSLFPLSGHDLLLESAFAVAIAGKADMPYCGAHVRL